MPKLEAHNCGELQINGCAYSDETVDSETPFARINVVRTQRDNHLKSAESYRESARKFQELAEKCEKQYNRLLKIARERGFIND